MKPCLLYTSDREREEQFRERFSQLDIIGEELTLKRFSEDEITKFEDYENIKKLSKKEKILVISEESKRYQEIFKGYPIAVSYTHLPKKLTIKSEISNSIYSSESSISLLTSYIEIKYVYIFSSKVEGWNTLSLLSLATKVQYIVTPKSSKEYWKLTL